MCQSCTNSARTYAADMCCYVGGCFGCTVAALSQAKVERVGDQQRSRSYRSFFLASPIVPPRCCLARAGASCDAEPTVDQIVNAVTDAYANDERKANPVLKRNDGLEVDRGVVFAGWVGFMPARRPENKPVLEHTDWCLPPRNPSVSARSGACDMLTC